MNKNLQESTWKSKFGDSYTKRNQNGNRVNITGLDLLKNKLTIKSAIEFGSNVGLNLDTIKSLFPEVETFGIEINSKAHKILKKKHKSENTSILDFRVTKKYDLVLICGVLIHQNPNDLNKIYKKLYNSSSKYIYLREYFSDKPVELDYRGKKGLLFKRDFAYDLIKMYPKLKIIDYGFHWKHDKFKNTDNENWFLFSK